MLSNAFKFTPDGGHIEVGVREAEGCVQFEFSDTGVGIPAHALPTIFDRFSQVDGSEKRRYAGTGIGLAMVKEYVHLHGGTVQVHSVPGEGTRFTITIPKGKAHLDPSCVSDEWYEEADALNATLLAEFRAEREGVPDAPHDLDAPSAAAPPAPADEGERIDREQAEAGPKPTVLVVDDVPDMRRFISQVLSEQYEVVTARDGQEGYETALRVQPDIVVSDVMMPRMTGFELLDALRAEGGLLARTPVVLVSARADMNKRLKGLDHGADDYLVKPFNATELVSRVRNLIRLRRKERELFFAMERLEERDARITGELQQARDFQQSILPVVPQVARVGIEVEYHPTDLVGGDYYDFAMVPGPDGEGPRLRAFIADATGHGVKASLATMFIKIEFDRVKLMQTGPAEVVGALNDKVAGVYGHLGLRFTAVCLDLCPATGRVWYATAAHPGPVRLTGGEILESETVGTFVGLLPGLEYPEERWQLAPGDQLFVYTDGITEQWNPDGVDFDNDGLVRSLAGAALAGRPLCRSVCDDVRAYAQAPLADDVTCMALTWEGPESG